MNQAQVDPATQAHRPHCEVQTWSQDAHLAQVYTGLAMLSRDKRITLDQKCVGWAGPDTSKPQYLRNATATHAMLIVDGSTRIYYDTHDAPEVDERAASLADLYFKRSYSQSTIPASLKEKIQPLGLNYAVYSDDFDRFELRRALADLPSAQARVRLLAGVVARGFDLQAAAQGYRPTVTAMHAAPRPWDVPRVLFMARAWDPADQADREHEQREQRVEINQTRARCVVLLRKEFGAAFTGGFKHTPYAIQQYRHVLLDDPSLASKRTYLDLLASHPICVATTGLHGSIGWKFGEYVAFSKAIVSEQLLCSVPGHLTAGMHYLEFHTPEECVEAAVALFEDAELRHKMMNANSDYYNTYLRPDQMIARTLRQAADRRLG
jgi:hypothetical protein